MTKIDSKITEQLEDVILENYLTAEFVYDSVVDQLRIDPEDGLFREHVIASLKKRTKSHIVAFVEANLSDVQKDELNQFISDNVNMEYDEAVIAFANKNPQLEKKVQGSLTDFFKDFIASFEELSEA